MAIYIQDSLWKFAALENVSFERCYYFMSISNSLLYQIHQMVFCFKAKVRPPSSFSLLFESYFWSNSRQISLPAGLISSSHITLGLSMGSHVFFFFFLNFGIWWIPNHISRPNFSSNCITDDFTFLFAYLGNIFFFWYAEFLFIQEIFIKHLLYVCPVPAHGSRVVN